MDSLARYASREYLEVRVEDEQSCDCIDWSLTEYRGMSRKERAEEAVLFVVSPTLVEPKGGFPLVFEVIGMAGLLATDEGRRKIQAAGLVFDFYPPLIGAIQWRTKRPKRSPSRTRGPTRERS